MEFARVREEGTPGPVVRDQISAPGSPDRPNEDALGQTDNVVWVIDGATGLGDNPLLEAPSDAAWLADAMGRAFLEVAATGVRDPATLLAKAAEAVELRFVHERLRAPEHRYEIPTAAVLLAVFEDERVEVAELGDCRLYLRDGKGTVHDVGGSPIGRGLERTNAKRLVTGGATIRTPDVLAHLRAVRDMANTPRGYWVFAPDPEPVRHARRHTIPLPEGADAPEARAAALLVTDGFDALTDDYGRYAPEALIRAAQERGLRSLVEELRHVETVLDPDAVAFPRFKRSDDATAILVDL